MGKIPAENTEKLRGKIFKFSNDLDKFKANCDLLPNPMLSRFLNLSNLNAKKSGVGTKSYTKKSDVGGESSASNEFNASEELNKLKRTWEDIRGKKGAKFDNKEVRCLYEFLDIEGRRASGSKRKSSKEGKSAAVIEKVIDMGDKVFDSFTQKGVAANLTSNLKSVVAALREKTSRTPGIGEPSPTREEFLNNCTFVDGLIKLIDSFKHSTENENIETALNREKTGNYGTNCIKVTSHKGRCYLFWAYFLSCCTTDSPRTRHRNLESLLF